jgi:septal ring factor EnvC (AmiA/AmiB activator)
MQEPTAEMAEVTANSATDMNQAFAPKRIVFRGPSRPTPPSNEEPVEQAVDTVERASGQPQRPSKEALIVLKAVDKYRANLKDFLLDKDRASEESNARFQELRRLKAKMREMGRENTDLTATVAKQKEALDANEHRINSLSKDNSEKESKIATMEQEIIASDLISSSLKRRLKEYEADFEEFEGFAGVMERVRERKRKRAQV